MPGSERAGMQVLRFAFTEAARVPALARETEEAGWDGLLLSDSQCLQSDVYAGLTLAAAHSKRLLLGPGVTNVFTRHPSVTAGAIATLQALSGGRAVLGLGRGDTALRQLGLPPVPLPVFEQGLRDLQAYLRGEAVESHGFPSRLAWLPSGPKVPVDVFASGPRTMALAGSLAERVTLGVGAEPAWVRWAVATVRRAREEAGLDPGALGIGLNVILGASTREAEALEQVRGNAALFAGFAGAARRVPGLLTPADEAVLAASEAAYRSGTAAPPLPDAFLRRFAVAGSPETVVGRLQELAELGLSHLVVVGPSKFAAPGAEESFGALMASEILPRLRESGARRSPG